MIVEKGKINTDIDQEFKLMIGLTGKLIQELIQIQEDQCQSIFNSSDSCPYSSLKLTLTDYIERVQTYTHFSKECLIIAIIYLDRYNMASPTFNLNKLNIHRILLTSLLLATKYQDDKYYDNKAFQFGGGVNINQLHRFQLHMFQVLGYNLFVGEGQYEELRGKMVEVYEGETQNQSC